MVAAEAQPQNGNPERFDWTWRRLFTGHSAGQDLVGVVLIMSWPLLFFAFDPFLDFAWIAVAFVAGTAAAVMGGLLVTRWWVGLAAVWAWPAYGLLFSDSGWATGGAFAALFCVPAILAGAGLRVGERAA